MTMELCYNPILVLVSPSSAEKLQAELRWRIAQLYAVNVTLVPDTANPELVLSEDQKRVRWSDTRQDLPNNPERFDTLPCVLGCEGFTSGRHCWEVEVGGGRYWAVGVSRESVRRKGEITLSPDGGIWALGQMWGDQFQAFTSPRTPLPLGRVSSRIRVCLDYDRGQVTFFDAGNKAPIFTFPLASVPGEKICPWLWDLEELPDARESQEPCDLEELPSAEELPDLPPLDEEGLTKALATLQSSQPYSCTTAALLV
ncbi:butyrophilin subfamily 1 member A1-like [Emydura macquarii macquarii]|uniref:butyrophilin subfamily 1 member A1-like n=1 Tax=Emydura macquarii macquarii TaxID=1129001 RepID=UPI003529ED77